MKILIAAQDEASATLDAINAKIAALGTTSTQAVPKTESMFGSFVIGQAVIIAATQAFNFLRGQLESVVAVTEESQRTQAQLDQAIRSTGGAAGVSATSATQLAEKLSGLDAVSVAAVESAEAMLLTYTNIHENVFPRTTQAVLDMATAMGGGATPSADELRSTAQQLGKALNDPTIGLTALQRVGVTFSAEQKKVIKTMAETGDVAAAQTIILDKLTEKFGGSAAVAAQTFEGRTHALTVALDEQKIKLGKELMPLATDWINELIGMTGKTDKTTASTDSLSVKFYQAGKVAEATAQQLVVVGKTVGLLAGMLVDSAGVIGGAFSDMFNGLRTKFDQFANNMAGLVEATKGHYDQAQTLFDKADALGKKGLDTTTTSAKIKELTDDFTKDIASIGDSWQASGLAMSQALDTTAIVQQINNANDAQAAATATLDKSAAAAKDFYDKLGTNPSGKAAAEQLKKIQEAAKTFGDTMKTVQSEMKNDAETYAKDAGNALDAYTAKLHKLDADAIASAKDTAQKIAEAQESGQAKAVDAYETAQSKLAALQQQQAQFWAGKQGTQENLGKYNELGIQIAQVQDALAKNKDLAADAAKDAGIYGAKGGTGLDAISQVRADTAEQVQKIQKDGEAKADAIQKELETENALYAKQKQDLIDATIKKYDDLKVKVEDGWQKVIDAAQGKVDQLLAVEAQMKGLMANVGAASSSTGTASAPIAAKDAGQVIQIDVMKGANVTVANGQDAAALAKQVAQAVGQAVQSARLGLTSVN